MKSKALIKVGNLPPAPPPTRANFHKHPIVGDGRYIKVLPTDYQPREIKPHPKAKGQGKGNRSNHKRGVTPQRLSSLEKARLEHSRRASEREDRMIELYKQGLSNADIAREMDAPIKSVAAKICRLRRDGVIEKRVQPTYEKEIVRLYNEGVYIHNIATQLGLTEGNVNSVLVRLRKQGLVGSRADRYWNKTQDSDLIRLWNKGYSCREIAKRMNVGVSVVFNHASALEKDGRIERRFK